MMAHSATSHGHSPKSAVIDRWEEAVDTYNQAMGWTLKPKARLQLPLLPWPMYSDGQRSPSGIAVVLLQIGGLREMNKALEEWND
jgi:hypothetical protein